MPYWDAVLKVGGSLYSSAALPRLMRALAGEARSRRLLVVPGGGPFADTVRAAWRRHGLGMRVAHRMAILAMDQYGVVLCDRERRARPARSLAGARRIARAGRLPVLLVSHLAGAPNDLPASWNLTSDSIAAWIATRIGARHLILLKSVDPPPLVARARRSRAGSPIGALPLAPSPPQFLARCGIVDRAFPEFARGGMVCWVVNGRKELVARRLREVLCSLEGAGEGRNPHRADTSPDPISVAGGTPHTDQIGGQRGERRQMFRPQGTRQRA